MWWWILRDKGLIYTYIKFGSTEMLKNIFQLNQDDQIINIDLFSIFTDKLKTKKIENEYIIVYLRRNKSPRTRGGFS